ncbi:hypothetical protein EHQ05_19260 [Leptospira yasudae]|uniref:AIPR family protein n=1 Tax=Leptospira yasudae TaxID=2202201 RepID=UPI001082CDD1|nr:AIPR family protein [Leptospira yasudae]TGK23328.1 hypothetical protein EHQ05_19260 [Leptospira yasudae]TGM09805.1 hypothetical protein EHQ86_00080 [Leptospira yasudae]
MENILIKGLVEDFKQDYNLSFDSYDIAFENFINFCFVTEYQPEVLDSDISRLDEVNVDQGKNFGIDGAALFINSKYITSIDEFDEINNSDKYLDIKILFIQSKTSSNINTGELNNFCLAVKNVVTMDSSKIVQADLKNFVDLFKYTFRFSARFSQNPTISLKFVYTGNYSENDKHIRMTIDQYTRDFQQLGLFSEINIDIIDTDKINRLYKDIKNNYSVTIYFEMHRALPTIKNVVSSYIGVISASEYLKLLVDDSGREIRRAIFYENVRDFQGENSVNTEIEQSIEDKQNQDIFSLLNNGVTVVTKNLKVTGSNFTLIDYQIVNGCQTSHLIFRKRKDITSSMFLPMKIVYTTDVELTNKVTKGTNRQTPVVDEAFEAMKKYHLRLEDYFNARNHNSVIKLYYERRSKQYSNYDIKINRSNVVSLHGLIRAHTAVFLAEPHSTHRYPGEILKAYKNKLFQDKQLPISYYFSALLSTKIEKHYGSQFHALLKKFRFHVMYLISLLLLGKNFSIDILKNESKIEEALKEINDKKKLDSLITTAEKIINDSFAAYRQRIPYELTKLASFTSTVSDKAHDA